MTRIRTRRNKPLLLLLVACCLCTAQAGAQQWITQRGPEGFCGYALDSAGVKAFAREVDFLRLREGDTLVDIGASSGWYEGAIGYLAPVKRHHFVLVDIDTACLNRATVGRMAAYYAALKGEPSGHSFSLHINTPKKLGLPPEAYSKFLIRNTLHEVADAGSLIKEVAAACRPGGQVIVVEQQPTKRGERHQGCREKLLPEAAITRLFEKAGFQLVEKTLQWLEKANLQLLRYARI